MKIKCEEDDDYDNIRNNKDDINERDNIFVI